MKRSDLSTKFADLRRLVGGFDPSFDEMQRQALITWGFRFGFALVGLLTIYLLFFGS